MADISTLPDSSVQAYDIALNQASEARAKQGAHVLGASASAPLATSSVDALTANASQDTLKAVVNSDAPMLPDPTGDVATSAATMRVVKGSDVFASGGDGVFAALEAMSDARQKDVNASMLVKRLQGADQVTAKKQEMFDKQDQIHGDQKAAEVKLAGSIVGLGLTAHMTLSGAKAERATATKTDNAEDKTKAEAQASNKQAWGATKRNVGMTIGSTVDAAVNMVDMNIGGQAQSNAAQVAQKQDAVQGQIYQNNTDSAGAWFDNAKEQRKSAQQAIMTHVQMWGDAVNNVWK